MTPRIITPLSHHYTTESIWSELGGCILELNRLNVGPNLMYFGSRYYLQQIDQIGDYLNPKTLILFQ